ncbi:MAG: ABC transporter transmembrane domain-containing protein [Bacteroidales bacterium]
MEENEKKKVTSGLKELFKLYRFLKPYRRTFAVGLIFLMISSGASLMFPKYLGNMVDIANQGRIIREISRTGLILLVIVIVQAIFSYLRTRIFVYVTEKTLASIRQHVYNHLIKLPMSFFSERRVGELNSRISSDISILQHSITETLADLLSQLLIITGGVTLMMVTSFRLTIFMLSVVPAMALFAFFSGRAIRRYSKKAQSHVAESNTIVEETLQGIQNVKAFTNEFFEIRRYREKTDEVARAGIKGGKYQAAVSFIILGFFIAMGLVIWRGALLIAKGEMEAGQLFSFVIYSGFIAGNIAGMAGVYTRLQRTIGAAEKLLLLLDEPAEGIDEVQIIEPRDILDGRIEFEQVDFRYPTRQENLVLHNVSFRIEPGQKIALVGPSGAGKSTLVSLLLRFYEPTAGQLLFDGRESTGALTKGDVVISQCEPDHMRAIINKLEQTGALIDIDKKSLRVRGAEVIKSADVKTLPYPGFPTDMQAQFMVLMAVADRVSLISENIFENRFIHVSELHRMGADIEISGNTAMIKGVETLYGAPVMATDLRASASLILAGLIAKGETVVNRVYHLDRGYEAIENKFAALNARIKRVKES